ncbi:methionine--tRNA ligase [Candidatus Micrarchaeota archaeon CG1_02_47_40]|nr:MAG: methionine--tRNA ligase [Candidatus Micrarchaeota archaeon CG1_02_47_40]
MNKRILVTAALPYANGPLHLGHIRSTYLPADIYARFQRLIGNDVLYICATDEHGTPIVAGAEKEGKTPQEFVDYYHERDEREFGQLGFSFDIFHRSSSEENKKMTQHFFEKLKENGHIYEQEVAALYCEKCRRFLPDRFVIGTCPNCSSEGQYSDYCDSCSKSLKTGEILHPKCITCKTTPVTKISKHYFFRLGSFSAKLEKWLTTNPYLQKEVANYLLNWIREGLADWDISRDLSWGVPVPGEKEKVFYVWFDAPIEYISGTVAHTKKWEEYWKGESEITHFIGKDIIYHHFLFWPAMLEGTQDGFRAPDKIAVRGYLNLEGKKFSKSRGWFVSLDDYLSAFPADYLRYYQTSTTPHSVTDADFVWKEFAAKINNELVASLGNLIHRTLVLLQKLNNSTVPSPEGLEADDNTLLAKITSTKEEMEKSMLSFQFKDAQEKLMALSDDFNKYLSSKQPWKEKDKKKINNCLYVCTRGISAFAVLLQPFLPFTSEKLAGMVGLGEKKLLWKDADAELLLPGVKIEKFEPLFKKIEDEKIREMENKLGK